MKYKYTIMNIFTVACVTALFFVPIVVFAIDTDNDGLSDDDELLYYTDMHNPDTDGDGYLDGVEVENNFSPHLGNGARIYDHDYDNDGLDDWVEGWFKSDRGSTDTDRDGFSDYDEVMSGFDPASADPMRIYERRVEVNKSNQALYYLVDGIKMLRMPVSTGNPWTETPSGEFEIQRMIANKDYVGEDYHLEDVPWNMLFKNGGYYLHGAYWHNDFGRRTHSHGCVNMRIPDAQILYKYVDVGMPVHIYGETPPNRLIQS